MWAQKARATVDGLFFVDDDHVAVGVTAVLHTVDGELHARTILAIDGVNTHAVIGVIDHIGSLGDGIARRLGHFCRIKLHADAVFVLLQRLFQHGKASTGGTAADSVVAEIAAAIVVGQITGRFVEPFRLVCPEIRIDLLKDSRGDIVGHLHVRFSHLAPEIISVGLFHGTLGHLAAAAGKQ